jgi:hypothetical protein
VKSFYRYRSIEALLGQYDELRTQTLFFADSEKMNDPMEGFVNLVWIGDRVLWANFFKHYLLCLCMTASLVFGAGEAFDVHIVKGILNWSEDTLPTEVLRARYEKTWRKFFATDGFEVFLDRLVTRRMKASREEVTYYLSAFHGLAVYNVLTEFIPEANVGQVASADLRARAPEHDVFRRISEVLDALEMTDEINLSAAQQFIFEFSSNVLLQTGLINSYAMNEPKARGWQFLCFEFADFYCRNIASVLYPKWYAACFVDDPSHAAMWAHYAASHTGVCLKFKAQSDSMDRATLTLNVRSEATQSRGEDSFVDKRTLLFEKVIYTQGYPEVEFFRSLGRTPMRTLIKEWYTFNGIESSASNVLLDEDMYRKRYWNQFQLMTTTKLMDWSYEGEFRLVTNRFLENTIPEKMRLMKYDFADLDGIVFGMNMALEDKIRVMKVVDEKCIREKRADFQFYQAGYVSGSPRLKIRRLNAIKFVQDITGTV